MATKKTPVGKFPKETCAACKFFEEDRDGGWCWASLPFDHPMNPAQAIRWKGCVAGWPACATFKGRLSS